MRTRESILKKLDDLLVDIRRAANDLDSNVDDAISELESLSNYEVEESEAVLECLGFGLPYIEGKYGASSKEAAEVRKALNSKTP